MDARDAYHESLYEKNIPVSMYRLSPDGHIIHVNQTLATMLGYGAPEELLGACFGQRIVSSPHARSNFIQLLHWNGHVEDFISHWRKRDGSVLLVRETGWIIPGEEGGVQFYEGSANPIHEARERKR